ARFAKSRTLAQALIDRGKVRLNRNRIGKVSQTCKPGDVVTLSLGPRIRIVRVVGLGTRRGPATEAAVLFEELTPQAVPLTDRAKSTDGTVDASGAALSHGVREAGAGRPTKRERRQTERLKFRFD
ncbi:MAG: RNA-binding S4 domain-containing protein, partial [Hyphomicrobium sp.]|nr:RNA-binding S4 domain-containing protein [Hyphomicrobium sp.]